MYPNRTSSSLSDSAASPLLYTAPSVCATLSAAPSFGGNGTWITAPSPNVLHAVGGPGPSSADQLPSRSLDSPADANYTSCAVTSVSHDATSSRICPTGCPQATGGYEATAYGIPLYVPVRVRPQSWNCPTGPGTRRTNPSALRPHVGFLTVEKQQPRPVVIPQEYNVRSVRLRGP